ncbi:MAG: Crp/Fnr family transcriptional regulator, partial [Arenicellales bacterium]
VLTLSGKEVIFDTLKQGDSFGLLAVITGTDTKASYVAKTDCELCVIDSDNFKLLMERFQTVASAVTLELAHSILKLTARMYEFRAMDAGQRTRAELLRHAVPDQGAFSACINILPTHEEIASTVFSHREAITKELSKLKKLGLINFQNGQMLIPDTRMIEEMIPDQALTGN